MINKVIDLTPEETFEKVVEVIDRVYDPPIPLSEIKPEHSLEDDLDVDELGLIEISLELEETFEIDIPDDLIEIMFTVKDIVKILCGQLPSKESLMVRDVIV